jgi:hypothetical protein
VVGRAGRTLEKLRVHVVRPVQLFVQADSLRLSS